MPDPHIAALHYRFRSMTSADDFAEATPLRGSFGRFQFELAAAMLVLRLEDHYADRERARDVVEPYLRAWEERALLSGYRIAFEYDHSDVVDRDPTPGEGAIYVESVASVTAFGTPNVVRHCDEYPAPDQRYAQMPLTLRLAERIRRTLDGEAELPATAYYVLSELERSFGVGDGGPSRRVAADNLRVSHSVLKKLAVLSTKGDPDIGRKAVPVQEHLTTGEQRWMKAASSRLAIRAG